jgi:hypothetical protein
MVAEEGLLRKRLQVRFEVAAVARRQAIDASQRRKSQELLRETLLPLVVEILEQEQCECGECIARTDLSLR